MSTLITRDYAVSGKRIWAPSGTYHASLIGSLDSNPVRDDAAMKMVQAGKFSQLRVRVDSSGVRNETSTVTLLKKGVGSANWQTMALSVSILCDDANDPKTFEDLDAIHEVSFAAGDQLCWEIVAKSGVQLFSLRHILIRVQDQ